MSNFKLSEDKSGNLKASTKFGAHDSKQLDVTYFGNDNIYLHISYRNRFNQLRSGSLSLNDFGSLCELRPDVDRVARDIINHHQVSIYYYLFLLLESFI